jgi:hypothetical protein
MLILTFEHLLLPVVVQVLAVAAVGVAVLQEHRTPAASPRMIMLSFKK